MLYLKVGIIFIEMIMLELVWTGALVSGALIMAIGSQNVFVIKQGLLKKNIFYVSFICFLCDFVLMTLGVLGLGIFVSSSQTAVFILAIAGSAFLYWYGGNSFIRAVNGTSQLKVQELHDQPKASLKYTVIATLAITLLNPHVYLDTVFVVGGIAGTLNANEKIWFLVGALMASFIWFFGLGYGARLASPVLAKPLTWRILDLIIAIVMFWVATSLLIYIM